MPTTAVHRRIRIAALVTVTGLGLALLPSAAQAAQPAVGQCYDYPASALKSPSNDAAPVACEGPHRAETFFVGALAPAFPDPARASIRQRLDATANNCTLDRMNAYLGLSLPIPSRFRPVAVFPSSAEHAAGARWIRCDVVFDAGLGIGGMTQPAPGWVAANAANPTAFAACTNGVGYSRVPSATKTQIGPCTNPTKQWILVARPTIAKIWQKYPGARALGSKSEKVCKPYKNTFNGGIKDAYARGWWFIYPMAKGWSAGTRTTSCWVPLKQYLATPK